jgi:hypothetical protein
LKFNRRFGEAYEAGSKQSHLLRVGFLVGLFFDHEDGSDIFDRNFG